MNKIALPSQQVPVDSPHGGVDPVWFAKLKSIASAINSGAVGTGLLTNSATSGFAFLPTVAGAPTGVPVAQPGYVPCVFDTTNNKLWIYNGAWKGVVVS